MSSHMTKMQLGIVEELSQNHDWHLWELEGKYYIQRGAEAQEISYFTYDAVTKSKQVQSAVINGRRCHFHIQSDVAQIPAIPANSGILVERLKMTAVPAAPIEEPLSMVIGKRLIELNLVKCDLTTLIREIDGILPEKNSEVLAE